MAILAFDVYGTLIDPEGMGPVIAEVTGMATASRLVSLWRQKQLEYSFRRGMMMRYIDFSQVTAQALDFAVQSLQLTLPADTQKAWLATYRRLPCFEDVVPTLEALQAAGHTLWTFSNGSREAVFGLLEHNHIGGYFQDTVSAEELKMFKPHPSLYAHFMRTAGGDGGQCRMVTANSFDAIGAQAAGMPAIWVKRKSDNILDPWEITPYATVQHLQALLPLLAQEGK